MIPIQAQEQSENMEKFCQRFWCKPKNKDTMIQAFIHRSYAADFKGKVPDNERLEFLWDAILGASICAMLYEQEPELSESQMTLYKIALVREETLANVAKQIQLDTIILVSKGEEKMGWRQKNSILADCLEAFIGLLYTQHWFAKAYEFIQTHIFKEIKNVASDSKSYKTRLQEWAQKQHKSIPTYTDKEHQKDDKGNTTIYETTVYVNQKQVATGQGKNKKAAQENAAENALKMLNSWQNK